MAQKHTDPTDPEHWQKLYAETLRWLWTLTTERRKRSTVPVVQIEIAVHDSSLSTTAVE
jgi:hypothetical protein